MPVYHSLNFHGSHLDVSFGDDETEIIYSFLFEFAFFQFQEQLMPVQGG